ncbi:hypothetical protein JG687_00008805, partial [Phytophthora cactorum]
DSDGNKTDPFLVFKIKTSKFPATARENTVLRHGYGRQLRYDLQKQQVGVQIYGNRAGWWNSDLFIEFLWYHFNRRENMHEPVLFLWVDFSGHWCKDVLSFARIIDVELMEVPRVYVRVPTSRRGLELPP